MKRIIIIGFLLNSFFVHSQILDHYLRCVTIENNDSIRLKWVLPIGTGEFNNYEVYHSTSPGSGFSVVKEIVNVFEDEWVHQEANPQEENFYFIQTNVDNGLSVVSDTLQAINLRLIGLQNNSIARLSWNALHAPPLPSYGSDYKLMRKYSFSDWELLLESDDFFYLDTIAVCFDSVSYKVEIENENGCYSVSNIAGDWMNDLTPPRAPVFDSVSLDSNGNAVLGWQPSRDSGTVAYVVYRDSLQYWPVYDTVFGYDSAAYIDYFADGCQQKRSYQIAAIDSCGNTSGRGTGPGGMDESLNTIYFETLDYNPCSSSVLLSWSAYSNAKFPVEHYKIFVSINNGNYEVLEILPPGSVSYNHQELDNNTSYSYFIRAENSRMTSTSCTRSFYTYYPEIPDFVYLSNVSVNPGNLIELKILPDTSAYNSGFKIFRRQSIDEPFNLIDSLGHQANGIIYYYDTTADPSQLSYYYKVEAIDSCGKSDLQSNAGHSIHLDIEKIDDRVYQLNWNYYSEWSGEVEKYEILRTDRTEGTTEVIADLSSAENQYTEDFNNAPVFKGYYYYTVRATEGEGNVYGQKDISYSNRVEVTEEANLYVPNAFNPDGFNNEFKPVFLYFAEFDYSMKIFNRWGEMIYESNDPGKGWKGSVEGKPAPVGTYVYYITYKNFNDQFIEKSGTFVLIK